METPSSIARFCDAFRNESGQETNTVLFIAVGLAALIGVGIGAGVYFLFLN